MVYPRDRAGHGDRRAGGIEIAEILILLSSRLKAGTTVISARARRLFFESSSRSSFLFEHDLRANASRLSRGKTGIHFPDHALSSGRGLLHAVEAQHLLRGRRPQALVSVLA